MAIENFTTGWTETDPNGRLSQTATRATFTDLINDTDGQNVAKDSAISFTDNFDVVFDFFINSSSATNVGDGVQIFELTDNNVSPNFFTSVFAQETTGGKINLTLLWLDFSPFDSQSASDTTTLLVDTVYYARLRRNDTGGAGTGIYTLDVYGSSANRSAGVSVLVSLSVNSSEQNDFILADVTFAYNNSETTGTTGYIENLDLNFTTIKFRKTFSNIGTGIGKRQLMGS